MPTISPQTTPYYGGGQVTNPADVIKTSGRPSSADVHHNLGTLAVDNNTGSVFSLTSKIGGVATWTLLGGGNGSIATLTGNTGGPIDPVAGNINIVGGDGVTVDGSGNTLTINTQADSYPITPYVVGPVGQAGYQTVQSAINAAQADGGGTVYVQPGTYTENLTLYSGVNVAGTIDENTTIIGVHTPPSSGSFAFQNITLQSSTHIFSSAVAGSADLILELCITNVTSGYTFNLPNWTGGFSVYDSGSIGSNDGFVNNTGGASVNSNSSIVGAGSSNSFVISGPVLFSDLQINCPGTFQGSNEIDTSTTIYLGTVTTADSVTFFVGNSIFQPNGSTAAISHGSSNPIYLDDTAINSSASNVIAGSGSGAVKLGNVSFDQSSGIASTLSVTYNRTIGRISPYVVGSSGNYTTIQSAITAANAAGGNATVYVQPGSYTESLTLSSTVNIEGTSDTGVTITGVHTPPTSGSVEFLNCTLASSTHIFSSASAGTTALSCVNCTFNVTNGYVFNLANWTGSLSVFQCGAIGTNDGFINNTGGSSILSAQSDMGAGTGQTMVTSGTVLFQDTALVCPMNMQTGTSFTIDSSQFLRTVTLSNNSTGTFSQCRFTTGSTAAITMSSSGAVNLTECSINSSNNPAISGAGAGTLTMTDVSFLSNSALAGTLTTAAGVIRGGNFISQYIVGSSPDAKYQTIQSAITAAASAGGSATVYVKPGSYTENLTLSSTVNIVGESDTGVTITGVHTPPTSGIVEFMNCTLASATHILSSASAGSATLSFVNCTFNVTNGYVFNLANWTGALETFQCGAIGANDGFVNNTGGSTILSAQSDLGAGTGQTMVTSGTVLFQDTALVCPMNMQTGSSFTIDASQFSGTVTLSNNSTGAFSHCRFSTGATAAITMSSSGAVTLSNCTINSSNNPSIAGAGAGTLTIGTCTFLDNTSLAGTLTVAYDQTTTGQINVNGNFVKNTAGNKDVYTSVASTTTAGANSAGTVVLVGGTATVATTAVTASSLIRLYRQGIGSTGAAALGIITRGTISAGTSFVINSVQAADATALQASDVSVVFWEIVN